MTSTEFREQIAKLTAQIDGRPLDAELDTWLNRECGVGSAHLHRFEVRLRNGSG